MNDSSAEIVDYPFVAKAVAGYMCDSPIEDHRRWPDPPLEEYVKSAGYPDCYSIEMHNWWDDDDSIV